MDAYEIFLKQRRNLILMSVMVSFLNITNAKLEEISLLGNKITINNPESIPFILIFVLGYFLIRYFQYSHEIDNKGFKEKFLKITEKKLSSNILKREYNKDNSELKKVFPSINDVIVTEFIFFHEAMPKNTAAVTFEPKEDGVVLDDNDLHIENKELIIPFVMSGFYIVFRTSLVTTYVLPVVFSIFAFSTYCEPLNVFFGINP